MGLLLMHAITIFMKNIKKDESRLIALTQFYQNGQHTNEFQVSMTLLNNLNNLVVALLSGLTRGF